MSTPVGFYSGGDILSGLTAMPRGFTGLVNRLAGVAKLLADAANGPHGAAVGTSDKLDIDFFENLLSP